jgi:hypothetical protein
MIGNHKTTITTAGGKTKVIYHQTAVVTFNDNQIILNTGGWFTATTKTRMNQTSEQFDLGFKVYQRDHAWFVDYRGETIPFQCDKVVLARAA